MTTMKLSEYVSTHTIDDKNNDLENLNDDNCKVFIFSNACFIYKYDEDEVLRVINDEWNYIEDPNAIAIIDDQYEDNIVDFGYCCALALR